MSNGFFQGTIVSTLKNIYYLCEELFIIKLDRYLSIPYLYAYEKDNGIIAGARFGIKYEGNRVLREFQGRGVDAQSKQSGCHLP